MRWDQTLAEEISAVFKILWTYLHRQVWPLTPQSRNIKMLLAASIQAILCLLLSSMGTAGADCTFTIPSMTADSCIHYDLSAMGASYTLSDDKFQYTFTLCQHVSIPKQCSKSSGAVAFQYDNTTCYSIGSNASESTYVVSYENIRPVHRISKRGIWLDIGHFPTLDMGLELPTCMRNLQEAIYLRRKCAPHL